MPSPLRSATALVSISILALLAASPGLATAATAPQSTGSANSPRPPGSLNLFAVDAVSPDRALSVGWFGRHPVARGREWNGTEWAATPVPGGVESAGLSVDALSTSDAWAVGFWTRHDEFTGQHTLAEHWDGSRWRIVDRGGEGNEQVGLSDVTMVASDDVWAVGTELVDETVQKTVIKHWDGTAWSVVPSPSPDDQHNTLVSVSAVSADDVWAVGTAGSTVLMLHWDGRSWTRVAVPQRTSIELTSLAAVSQDDVWTVGHAFRAGRVATLVEHWDGHRWSVVATPRPPQFGNTFTSVSAVSPDDVWAVGSTYVDAYGQITRALIEHWDGSQWSVAPTPHPGALFDRLQSVSADSATDAWAVGTFGDDVDSERFSTLLLRWNGSHWVRYPAS